MLNGLFHLEIYWNKYSNCTNVDAIYEMRLS